MPAPASDSQRHPPQRAGTRRRARTRGRGPAERAAAWLLTGPVGHLAAGVTDLAVLAWTLGRARLRGERV